MSKIVLRGENKHMVRVCYTYLLVEYTLMDITKDIEFVNKHIDSVFNKIMQDDFVLNLIYNTTQKINNSIIGRVFLNTVDIITPEVLYNGTLNTLKNKHFISFDEFKKSTDLFLILYSLIENPTVKKYLSKNEVEFVDYSKYTYTIRGLNDLKNGNSYDLELYNELIEYTSMFNIPIMHSNGLEITHNTLHIHKYLLLSKFTNLFSFKFQPEKERVTISNKNFKSTDDPRSPRLYYCIPVLKSESINVLDLFIDKQTILNNNTKFTSGELNIYVEDKSVYIRRPYCGYKYTNVDSMYLIDDNMMDTIKNKFKYEHSNIVRKLTKERSYSSECNVLNHISNNIKHSKLIKTEPSVDVSDGSRRYHFTFHYDCGKGKVMHLLNLTYKITNTQKNIRIDRINSTYGDYLDVVVDRKKEDTCINYIDNLVRTLISGVESTISCLTAMSVALK